MTGHSINYRAAPKARRSPCRTLARHHRPAGWWSLPGAFLLYACASVLASAGEFTMTRQAILKIDEEHGEYARRRVDYWQQLISSGNQHTDLEKLRLTNDFFNELEFINDAEHWGKDDYWATPLQTLVSNGGDCEDFSIAKYFTLLEMGIPPERMRLTYVKALRLNQAHMVLTYFPAADAEPLVLDNLDTEIRPANKRNDLLPVYSFNVDGLWLAKSRSGESKHVGKSTRLSPWRDVIARINSEFTR
ncbi:MAG: transglutaminase-like cysteine peptidase [Gammaproteobacteria bacterium]|nr:transglutaminase-like cysteine peptidase [Gammaproteobacteria bacterium]